MVIVFFVLSGCSGKPYAVKNKPDLDRVTEHVWVVSHGWHTGIVIPREAIEERLPELAERFNYAPFIEIGWGDKGFYQSEEITTGLTLRAMFWSPGSVVHVVSVVDSPACYFRHSQVTELILTKGQLAGLIEFIDRSFARDKQGRVITLKSGIYGDSQFYEGEGRYHILNTCNKWTAKALKSAAIDIDPTLKLTSDSVMSALENSIHKAVSVGDRSSCPGY